MNDYSNVKNQIIFDYKNEEIYVKNPVKIKSSFVSPAYGYGFMGMREGAILNQNENGEMLAEIMRFSSALLSKVKYFEFKLKEARIKVIAIEEGIEGWNFLVDNWQDYLKVLSYIQNPDKELVCTMGLQKGMLIDEEKYFFYRHCFKMSFEKYNSHSSYFDDKLKKLYGIEYYSDLRNVIDVEIYDAYDKNGNLAYLNDANFMTLFTQIKEFLPENISNAKKREAEKERVETTRREQEEQNKRIQAIIEIKREIDNESPCSLNEYMDYLEDVDLHEELEALESEIDSWEKAKLLNAIDNSWIENRIEYLEKKILWINQKYEQDLRQMLSDNYGSIEDMKTELLKLLKGMQFNDALNLYFQYTNLNNELVEEYEESVFEEGAAPYLLYADFFKHASIYVSNYLNEINKMKSKKKMIPQKQINEALMYMYCAESVEEALELQAQKDYLDNRRSGSKGEAEVEYALKWLVGNYIKIEPVECGKYGEKAIVLNNKDFIDEPQEFDHIVISRFGIFNIETKNYIGKLIVDKNGNWIRIKEDGNQVGERNPIQQVRRHEIMLRSIVGEDIPIINVLVMANPKMIIEGVENCSIPLLKSDRLEEFISLYQSDKVFNEAEMKDIEAKIKKHRAQK